MNDPRSGYFRFILPAACIASALSGCDIGDSPSRIGAVRLEALLAEFSVPGEAGAVGAGISESEWPAGLEAALDAVAERRDVVLLPAEAALAGAPDYTREVAFELARSTGRIGYFGELDCASPEPGAQP
ncbi:MAG: hypothetical protein OXQ89_05560 [Rhodospirillaceae bacterium]|nr:hypothetical protein [Rhodospirillaceae bacterium]MDD9997193.1 hypothetical protein [Rhodospirillaceae bacterium]MDE0361920.1 hypothetical protein [Rhodospirillaceae bacterium]